MHVLVLCDAPQCGRVGLPSDSTGGVLHGTCTCACAQACTDIIHDSGVNFGSRLKKCVSVVAAPPQHLACDSLVLRLLHLSASLGQPWPASQLQNGPCACFFSGRPGKCGHAGYEPKCAVADSRRRRVERHQCPMRRVPNDGHRPGGLCTVRTPGSSTVSRHGDVCRAHVLRTVHLQRHRRVL